MELPNDFIERMRDLLGEDYEDFKSALEGLPSVSVRLNKNKVNGVLHSESVPWCETGYYLDERIPFTFDPAFHAGAYYVQEASSMFLEQAIKNYVKKPVRCLDLCAAPGGKSTHLCDILPEDSLLVCNEVNPSRVGALYENIVKWGSPYTIVCSNEPKHIGKRLPHFFDVIVADLPCSGEGMFRKDRNSINEWSANNVNMCAGRQRHILKEVWDALRPGGLLIYSTCTYNIDENEQNLFTLYKEYGAKTLNIPIKTNWGIVGAQKHSQNVYRFFPHRTRGEGFFIAALLKPDDGSYRGFKNKDKELPHPYVGVDEWLIEPDRFHIELSNNIIKAYPWMHYYNYAYMRQNNMDMLYSGILVGTKKGSDLIPSHPLAMSNFINREYFPTRELNTDEAITYLQKGELSSGEEKGHVLLTYNGLTLGFIKQLTDRVNNLYPTDWRIKSQKKPEREE
jgi:16S rRNA C967 or C1407 C5-methylase (RsmB/RsmF family)/NOL1/NOP2/fmu family ribosome biogenesis protein